MQYIVGLVYLVLSILPFLEQSVFSSLLRNICLAKVCEIFMETTRLEHLPNASRITFIAFMVWEIRKSQGVTSALIEA
jgi:type III secretory pathway component EscT